MRPGQITMDVLVVLGFFLYLGECVLNRVVQRAVDFFVRTLLVAVVVFFAILLLLLLVFLNCGLLLALLLLL
ncbi:MAG: hypothetical protein J3R72DRAFT_459207 [Linnemannia gamsii]|nr:MAG: hypothetical protein J3R72DRAFT_459207 [Linnemannia gamsii]